MGCRAKMDLRLNFVTFSVPHLKKVGTTFSGSFSVAEAGSENGRHFQ